MHSRSASSVGEERREAQPVAMSRVWGVKSGVFSAKNRV